MRIAFQFNKQAKFFSFEKFESIYLDEHFVFCGYGYAFFKIIIYIYK